MNALLCFLALIELNRFIQGLIKLFAFRRK
jgi:hypothetical protein